MTIAALPRLELSDLTYIGSFGLPTTRDNAGDPSLFGGASGCDFQNGGDSIAYNPANNSLFVTTSPMDGYGVAEVAIPGSLYSGTNRTLLPLATYIQNCRRFDPTMGRAKDMPAWNPAHLPIQGMQSTFMHSICLHNGRLIGSVAVFYDASSAARRSHFYLDSLNLATAQCSPVCLVKISQSVNTTGTVTIQDLGDGDGPEIHHAGNSSGYMFPIPTEWRAELGNVPIFGGCTGLAIVSRTSAGPPAHGWNPDLLSPTVPVRSKLYQQFNILGPHWGYDTDDPYYVALNGGVITTWGGSPSHPDPTKRKRMFSNNNVTGAFVPIPGYRTILETNSGPYYDDWSLYGGLLSVNDPQLYDLSLPPGHPFYHHPLTDTVDHRATTGNYGVPRDPTNPWTVLPQSTRWQRRIRLWDATNFSTTYNGSNTNQDANRPYAMTDWVPPIKRPIETVTSSCAGGAVDAANRRIYLVGKFDNAASPFASYPVVNVYTYPAASAPAGPTIRGNAGELMKWGRVT